jgi:hypothetical protein
MVRGAHSAHSGRGRARGAVTYSEAAVELRICRATRRDGLPCRAWAMWDSPDQLCATHAGVARGGPTRVRPLVVTRSGMWASGHVQHARYPPCRCPAYEWPHRPGGGLCCWPDPPQFRLVMNDGKDRGSTGFDGVCQHSGRGDESRLVPDIPDTAAEEDGSRYPTWVLR